MLLLVHSDDPRMYLATLGAAEAPGTVPVADQRPAARRSASNWRSVELGDT